MIQNIIQLLEIAKQEKVRNKTIDIALGKYKFPESIKEGYEQYKKGLWQK
jgi:hypothetical protein